MRFLFEIGSLVLLFAVEWSWSEPLRDSVGRTFPWAQISPSKFAPASENPEDAPPEVAVQPAPPLPVPSPARAVRPPPLRASTPTLSNGDWMWKKSALDEKRGR